MTAQARRVLVALPSPMMARNFLRSDALALLRERGVQVAVVSPHGGDQAVAESQGARWVPWFHPRRTREAEGPRAAVVRWGRSLRHLAGLALHMSLTYRFNSIQGFRGFAARLKQSWPVRKVYLREGLPMAKAFGFPFARSRRLYQWLYRLYYAGWQSFGPVNQLVRDMRPDLVVLSMVQTQLVTPYALAAARAGVPILGINGSWDQPTTKGPVCPGVSRILVQNDIVRDELVRHHGFTHTQLATIGWLQMDAYVRCAIADRGELLRRLGIPTGSRYLLFAANAPRLGPHEPELLRDLAQRIQSGELGPDVVVLCRCHPQDRDWERRWGWAASMPQVVVEPPDLGPLDHLASVIRHAAVVIASAGSINLDAVALDVPTIGIAWEDGKLPYWDRPARAYELEHLAELRTSPGMAFAGTLPELVAACRRYLHDPSADAAGREDLRRRFLHALDGRATERLVDEIMGMLG